jgi:cytochrome P450
MTDFATVDFLTDQSLVPNPYPYYDYLREQSPVVRTEPHGFVAVTGYEEALEVYKNP